MQFTDRLTLDGEMRRASDGAMMFTARVARGGNIQEYLGSELGIADKQVVRVYRPAEAVFRKDALATYAHVPITVGHPKTNVTADNWKDLAVGEVGDEVARDGEFVRVPMMLRDAKAIRAVEGGIRELSMGYDANVTIADGVTPSGEAFDAIMSDFKMNHVAIVDMARGGKELRIGDHAGADKWGASPVHTADTRGAPMADLRKVLVDGLQVETTDAGVSAIEKLTKERDDARKAASDAGTSHQAALAAKDGELAKKDAEIDALKGKVLDAAAIDGLVAARANLITVAKAIAKDVKTGGLADADIRKAVVVAKLGDAAIKDKPAAYIDARFEILAEEAANAQPDQFRDALLGGIHTVDGDDKSVKDAYAQMVKDMQSGSVKPVAAN